jgi:maleate cis-trans isomerase
MTRHFGVLIPSTNTTAELEYNRLLPPQWQAHFGRLRSSTPGQPFAPPRDEDVAYQARLLGTAKVEIVTLIQTSASLHADDYDATATVRMSREAGVPAMTSAVAVGEAVRALGVRRIALVSPYSDAASARARHYFEVRYELSVAAVEGFAMTDSYAIGQLRPEMARAAFARIDRPEIEAFVVPGGNFPTMASIPQWEAEFKKPVVTTNQAAFWAVLRRLGSTDRLPGLGRLLEMSPG